MERQSQTDISVGAPEREKGTENRVQAIIE